MGTSATKAKNKYADKTYDQLRVLVKKSDGGKNRVKARADKLGLSINAYINMLIDEDMKKIGQ
jgi:hypothetical protein